MIKCRNLQKTYPLKKTQGFQALKEIDLEIAEGDFTAVTGPSGCGKSTLLNILGFLDNPTAGSYFFKNTDVAAFTDAERSLLRRESVGFVFQSFNLLPRFSALDNVCLPMLYMGAGKEDALRRAYSLLEQVGLKGKEKNTPPELSGGERQRVGVARALANRPALLLADEPTGNLDSKTGLEIVELLKERNARGLTVVMVTHDQSLAKMASRAIKMVDGKIL